MPTEYDDEFNLNKQSIMSKYNTRINGAYIIAVILFLIWSVFFIRSTTFIGIDGERYYSLFDDAMISMRYAWNFSHGLGLVWNDGELIQGYTNLFMTLLMSVFAFFMSKQHTVFAIQILGVFFMLLIAVIALRIADYVFDKDSSQIKYLNHLKLLLFIMVLSYYPLLYWSLMGMETGLLTVLLLSGLLFSFKYIFHNNAVYLYISCVLLSLAYMTRTDSIIFSALIWLYVVMEFYRNGDLRGRLHELILASACFTTVVMAQLLFQYYYYGQTLPNTYVLKLEGMSLSVRLDNGLGFVEPYIKTSFPFLFLTVLAVVYKANLRIMLLFSLAFASLAYQVYVGGDAWAYWRMMSPTFPLVMILSIFSLNCISNKLSSLKYENVVKFITNYRVALISVVSISMLVLANKPFFYEWFMIEKPYQVNYNKKNVNTALALNEITYETATIGVYWAGSIPFYIDRKAIDFLGKSDTYISSLEPDLSGSVSWAGMKSVPGHNKYDLHYSIQKLKPTYAQSFKWGKHDLRKWAESNYVRHNYKGVDLNLLRGSKDIMWEKL